MSSTLTESLLVIAAESMDPEAFAKHMTYRHPESLGGLPYLDPDLIVSTGTIGLYRAYHDRLHAWDRAGQRDDRHPFELEHPHEHAAVVTMWVA